MRIRTPALPGSLAVALLLVLSRVAPSAVMIDERGRQAVCGAVGVGVAGVVAAGLTYQECVDRHKTMGFVKLKEFEKSEAPKVDAQAGITPPKADPPRWEVGDVWIYQLGGMARGMYREEVVGKEVIEGLPAYVLQSGGSTLLVNEGWHLIQFRREGTPTQT